MAVKGQEVEGITGGIEAASTVKGAFNQNMLFRRESVEVREGFGQVVELDTTMNAIAWNPTEGAPKPDRLWGYRNHLGSHLMETAFGHRQVVSVFSAEVFTGDRSFEFANSTGQSPASMSEFASIYIVSIYDLNSGQKWEEPVYHHTASFSEDGPVEMPGWHGNYESGYWQKYTASATLPQGAWFGGVYAIQSDQQKWVRAPEPDVGMFFVELDDILYFGNKHSGLLAYIPAKFRGRWKGNGLDSGTMRRDRSRQANTVFPQGSKPIYSESSVVIDAVAVDGPFATGFTYLNQSEFPKPDGGAAVEGRLAMFEGNNVYFSDVSFPTSVVADNILFVPSEEKVSAIAEHTGNLLIFTENEVWYFRPSPGFLITQGSLIKLASGIGCISGSAVVKTSGSILWMDRRGVYSMGGSLSVEKVSDDIEPFFNDFITNPITSFYTTNGNAPAAADMGEQSQIRMAFDPHMVSAVYFHKLEAVVFCLPALNGGLYFGRGGQWSWWSFESTVAQDFDRATSTFANAVAASKGIRNPWMLSDVDDLFIVGSYNDSESGERVNQLPTVGAGDHNTTSRPYCLLQYGRGGGVDRSLEFGEDRRSLAGNWVASDEGDRAPLVPTHSDHYIYVGKPIPIPEGTTTGVLGSLLLSDPVPAGSFWLPIGIVPGNRDATDTAIADWDTHRLSVRFTFDSANFETIGPAASSQLVAPVFFLPPERQGGLAGWTVSKPAANTVDASWDGAGAGTNVMAFGHPVMNLNPRQHNRLIYIPIRPIQSGGEFKAYQGMDIQFVTKTISSVTAAGPVVTTSDCRAYSWEETFLGDAEKGGNLQAIYPGSDSTPDRLLVAQPVDWAYKTRPVASEGHEQIKGRGLRVTAISRGAAKADQRLTEGWPMGIMNTLSGADYKEWSSQVVDIIPAGDPANTTGATPAVVSTPNEDTLRTRFKRSSTGTLVDTAFGVASGPVWGTPGGSAADYVYIADEEESSLLAISDGIRGQSVSYMLWGHIQNKAEGIVLYSAKVILRMLGGTRRRGR